MEREEPSMVVERMERELGNRTCARRESEDPRPEYDIMEIVSPHRIVENNESPEPTRKNCRMERELPIPA